MNAGAPPCQKHGPLYVRSVDTFSKADNGSPIAWVADGFICEMCAREIELQRVAANQETFMDSIRKKAFPEQFIPHIAHSAANTSFAPVLMPRQELAFRNWRHDRISSMIMDPTLQPNFAWQRAGDYVFFYGPGSDLELLFFSINLTPADVKLLGGMKISLE